MISSGKSLPDFFLKKKNINPATITINQRVYIIVILLTHQPFSSRHVCIASLLFVLVDVEVVLELELLRKVFYTKDHSI